MEMTENLPALPEIPEEVGDLVIPAGLSFRQEIFARAFLTCGGNAAEAYVIAYDPPEHIEKTQIHRRAHLVRNNPRVAARINELLRPVMDTFEVTAQSLYAGYQDALAIAKTQHNPNAMVNALNGMAKVAGLDRPADEGLHAPQINVIYEVPQSPDGKETGDDGRQD